MAKKKDSKLVDWVLYNNFVMEFKSETDRAAVVLGAAKLDLVMYQILKEYFIASASSNDELLDGDSPLSTFSSKINIMHRLGLIDASFARALHMIRKIRNSFAHEVSGCSLKTGSHSDRVKELSLPFKNLAFYGEFKNHFFDTNTDSSVEFRAVLALMVGRLESMLVNLDPIKATDPLELTPPHWEKTSEESSNKTLQQSAESDG